MRRGAIVLCGGASRRMGTDKAALCLAGETLLARVVRIAAQVCRPIAVVAAPGQTLPELPHEVRLAHDARPGRGPLEGIAAGLAALADDVDAALVTTCDAPFLAPAFITRLFDLLGDHDMVVPYDATHHHVLSAVYRPRVLPLVAELLAEDRLRPYYLLEKCRGREVSVDVLREVDPTLASLENINHPEDFRRAVARLRAQEG